MLPLLIHWLEHEPSVGLAIVDSSANTLHANQRFKALTASPRASQEFHESREGKVSRESRERRVGVWARVGPDAVRTAATERLPTVLRFIHEGVQMQCDIWPLPYLPVSATAGQRSSAGSSSPNFLVIATEGRHDPGASARPSTSGEGAAGSMETKPGEATGPDEATSTGPGSTTSGMPSGSAPARFGGGDRFITLAPLMAELGALSALTSRELEVLALIGQGMATREIASALDRSPRTIERHCDAIHKKLGTTNRVQMARYALQAGLTAEAGKMKRV